MLAHLNSQKIDSFFTKMDNFNKRDTESRLRHLGYDCQPVYWLTYFLVHDDLFGKRVIDFTHTFKDMLR